MRLIFLFAHPENGLMLKFHIQVLHRMVLPYVFFLLTSMFNSASCNNNFPVLSPLTLHSHQMAKLSSK